MIRLIISFLFLISGAAGLIYQVVWSRSLTLIFGSTTLAVSTVITAFMAGLGLGSWIFGRYSDRLKKALPLYALLEVGIALAALLFPLLIKVLQPAFLGVSRNLPDSYILFPLLRFLICLIALLLPTVLMGGTLPVMTRFFVKEKGTLGGNVSTLYALNTFGAMIGCFTAGFFLIPELGINGTVAIAVAINLLAAAVALVVSRTEKALSPAGSTAEQRPELSVDDDGGGISPTLVLWFFGIAGFTSLAYEVLWTRALLFHLGWFAVYAFTIILTTFLFGIAAGSASYTLFFRKGRNLLAAFAIIEITIGIFGALSPLIFGGLFEIILGFEAHLPSDNWWRFIFARAGGSFAVMLVPTFLMGLAFPLASALYARAGRGYGSTVGNIYASNTLGAILGSMLAGFLLLPALGLARSMAFVSLINLILGGVILLTGSRDKGRRGMAFVLLLVVFGGGLINLLTSNNRPMILQSRHFKNPNRPMQLLYANEGATTSLAVLHDVNSGHDELNINGESTAYTTYTDMQVHLMLSHLPLLCTDNPEKVLVIGFGLGSTSYGATLHPTVQEVRCVELVPKEVETAEFFESVNHGVLKDDKFKLTIDDGRNFLFQTSENFDLISFNAIHPSHSPALYTVEFYEECLEHLTDDGVICAWVPNNSFTELQFRILLRTFTSAFPHSSLWYVNPNHLVLIGTRNRLQIDFDDFRQRLAIEPVRRELERFTMEDPYQMLAYHLMDEKDLERYTRGAPVNADGKPYLEYSRELYTRPEIIDAMRFHRSSVLPYLEINRDSAAVVDTLKQYEKSAYHLLAAQTIHWMEGRSEDKLGREWRIDAEMSEAYRATPGQINLDAIAGFRQSDIANLTALFKQNPDSPDLLNRQLRYYLHTEEWDKIREVLENIRGKETTGAELCRALGAFARGDFEKASTFFHAVSGGDSPVLKIIAREYRQIIELEEKRTTSPLSVEELLDLGDHYWLAGDRDRGLNAFHEAVELAPERSLPHFRLGRALENAYRLDRAAEEYAAALERPVPRLEMQRFIVSSLDRVRIQIALRDYPNEKTSIQGAGGEPIVVDPWSPGFHIQLGLLFLEERKPDRASLEFRIATILDAENVEARISLSRAYGMRGLLAEAAEEMGRAIQLAPERTELRDELEWIEAGAPTG